MSIGGLTFLVLAGVGIVTITILISRHQKKNPPPGKRDWNRFGDGYDCH